MNVPFSNDASSMDVLCTYFIFFFLSSIKFWAFQSGKKKVNAHKSLIHTDFRHFYSTSHVLCSIINWWLYTLALDGLLGNLIYNGCFFYWLYSRWIPRIGFKCFFPVWAGSHLTFKLVFSSPSSNKFDDIWNHFILY